MIDKNDKKAIGVMAQQGAIRLIQAVADEIGRDLGTVEFEGTGEQTIYKLGEHNGKLKGMQILIETLESFATQ